VRTASGDSGVMYFDYRMAGNRRCRPAAERVGRGQAVLLLHSLEFPPRSNTFVLGLTKDTKASEEE
jgi:hypothetical protein